MRRFSILLASAGLLTLAACATPQPYGPAASAGAAGYSSQMIEDDRARVTYRGRGDAARINDYALRRSAELTLDRGYDWFEVVNRFTEPEGYGGGGPRFSVGAGTADFGRASAVGGGVGIGFGGNGQNGYTATMEIVMGQGPAPERGNVYDARAVLQSMTGR